MGNRRDRLRVTNADKNENKRENVVLNASWGKSKAKAREFNWISLPMLR